MDDNQVDGTIGNEELEVNSDVGLEEEDANFSVAGSDMEKKDNGFRLGQESSDDDNSEKSDHR